MLQFVEANIRGLHPQSVLDVGSRMEDYDDDRPRSPRHLFSCDYLGVDARKGPGVDMVLASQALHLRLEPQFDLVLCLEMLEHDPAPWETIQSIHDVCLSKARLLVSVPNLGYPRHDHPSDYFRFSEEGLESLMGYGGFSEIEVSASRDGHTVFGKAVA